MKGMSVNQGDPARISFPRSLSPSDTQPECWGPVNGFAKEVLVAIGKICMLPFMRNRKK